VVRHILGIYFSGKERRNLMLDAIEAMRNSSGDLTVRSQLQGGQLLFSVIDTGAGLPTENVDCFRILYG
jgi:hypothetical protein